MLYGYPGSGKTHVARQLSDTLQAAHLHSDRIRSELFTEPRFDKEEDQLVEHLMLYMAEEFLKAGVSVVYDANVNRLTDRREFRNIARKAKANTVLVWLQIDADSAFARLSRRDRRTSDDKYARNYSRESFEAELNKMQNPNNEDYIVISCKLTFNTQRSSIIKNLYDIKAINIETTTANVVKPELVNLIPNPSAVRVDNARRNILIR